MSVWSSCVRLQCTWYMQCARGVNHCCWIISVKKRSHR